MQVHRLSVFILTMVLSVMSTSISAAEELFDTKAAEKHIEQGITFLKAKNFDAAIKEFDEASVILPDAESYYYLGYAYYLKGRSGDTESRKRSIEYFDKVYEIDPNFSPTRYKPGETEVMETKKSPKQEAATPPAAPQSEQPMQPAQPEEAAQPSQPAQPEQPGQPAPPAEQPRM